MESGPDIVDRIYAASVVPEQWADVLHELGEIAGATGGSLFVVTPEHQHSMASRGVGDRADRAIRERWLQRGQLIRRAAAMQHPGFVLDHEIMTPAELEEEPLYRDFWRPQGIGQVVSTNFVVPTGETIAITFTRLLAKGSADRATIERLDALRPHIARAVILSARLQLEHARAASQTLAALGLPALVLSGGGKVLAVNQLVETLAGQVVWRGADRIALTDKHADRLLRQALERLAQLEGAVRSFPVRDVEGIATQVAHLVPIRLAARDIFARSAAALVFSPITRPQAPPVELVQSLFDVTPAEARVARALAAGRKVGSIASERGVSVNTVRTQVRGLLDKTGSRRLTDLVALLNGIGPPRP
ncbi:MAG TPA: helix-turn-helix transcriptional regulator [Rhizomicrobium sp.]|jgi:DNA-binding NarL/FixJ family response regulator